MFKLILLILGAGGVFLITPAGQKIKDSAINVINPATQERKNLANLKEQLDDMTQKITSPEFQNLNNAEKTKELKTMISEAKGVVNEVSEQAEDSDIMATISTVVKKTLPDTWTSEKCK